MLIQHSCLREIILTIPLLNGIGIQIAGGFLTSVGKWMGNDDLMRAGRQYRRTGEMQRTMADARSVIQQTVRRTQRLH